MPRKKRKPDGEKPKRRPQRPADLPDRRALEGAMRQFVAGLQGQADQDTPLAEAQALLYRACEERDEGGAFNWRMKRWKPAPNSRCQRRQES